jgi:hypothetical protein
VDTMSTLQDPEVIYWSPAQAVVDVKAAPMVRPRNILDRRDPRDLARGGRSTG